MICAASHENVPAATRPARAASTSSRRRSRLAREEQRRSVVYVIRIATPDFRDYYLYHADQAELSKAFSALRAIYPNHRVEFEATDDIAWEQYGKYVSYDPNGTA
jgi:hypothetical protein